MNLHPSFSCRLLFVAALTVTILAPSTQAEDRVLNMGKPEQVGMSARRLEIVNQILADETKSGRVTAASVLVAPRPNRSYSAGSTNRFKSVDVNSPPRITIAIGYSTSYPGLLPLKASGKRPSPAVAAVIKMGMTRSSAATIARSIGSSSGRSRSSW